MPYQPSAPQQLPQLQARPDLSGAQALQTVGETIEKLGAMGADYLKYRKAATTAAATEAADQWEQDQMHNRGLFEQEAVGSKIAAARKSYHAKLDGDTSKYEADLNQAARAEFKKRVDFKRKDFKSAGDLYAKKQGDRFIVDTSEMEIKKAKIDLARVFAANGGVDEQAEPWGRINAAATSLSDVLGVDKDKLLRDVADSARYDAMAHLSKTGTDEQILRYYEDNKGYFGPNELAAEQVTNESRKNIDANQAFSDIVPLASDLSGNFSPEVAYSQDISDLSPDVQAKVNKKIADYAAADWKKRKEIGEFTINEYEMAQIDGSVTTLEKKPEFQDAVKRLTPEHLQALKYRQLAGPKESHPDDLARLRAGENSSSNTPLGKLFDSADLSTLRVTNEVKRHVLQKRQERASRDENKILKEIAWEVWSEGGMRKLPSFDRDKTVLSPEKAKELNDWSEFVESLIDRVKNNEQLEKSNIGQMRAAARELKMTFDEKAPGIFGGGVGKTPFYKASVVVSPPTQAELAAANVRAGAPADEAALAVAAHRLNMQKKEPGAAPRPDSPVFSAEPIGETIPLFGARGAMPNFAPFFNPANKPPRWIPLTEEP
jgi:hypothetical protein